MATVKIKKLTTKKAAAECQRNNTELKLFSRGIESIETLDLPQLRYCEALTLAANLTSLSSLLRGHLCLCCCCEQAPGDMQQQLDAAPCAAGLPSCELPESRRQQAHRRGLRWSQIKRIPPAVFSRFEGLQVLVLNNNSLDAVPHAWWKKGLHGLNTLVLSHNKIASLSDSGLSKLTLLTKLSASHNQLTELPDLSACTLLQELRLGYNSIAAIPEWLVELPQLRLLELGHNAVSEWSEVNKLTAAPALVQLTLRGCPISGCTAAPGTADKYTLVVRISTAVHYSIACLNVASLCAVEVRSYSSLCCIRLHHLTCEVAPAVKTQDGKRTLPKISHGHTSAVQSGDAPEGFTEHETAVRRKRRFRDEEPQPRTAVTATATEHNDNADASTTADDTAIAATLAARQAAVPAAAAVAEHKRQRTSAEPQQQQQQQQPSALKQCKFGVRCSKKGCQYDHTATASTAAAGATAADTAVTSKTTTATAGAQKECRFGAKCTRNDCKFTHAGRATAASDSSSAAAAAVASGGEASSKQPAKKATAAVKSNSSVPVVKQKPCRDGAACTRADCKFDHTAGAAAGAAATGSSGAASAAQAKPPKAAKASRVTTSGDKGTDAEAPMMCRFAAKCTRPDCIFAHPAGRVAAAAGTSTADKADAAPKRVAKPAAATTAATATAASAKEPKKKATRGRSKLITPEVITAVETDATVDTTAATKKRKAAISTTAATTATTAGNSSYDFGDVSSGDELPLPSKKKQAAVTTAAAAGESGVVEVKLVKRRSQKGTSGKHDAAFSVQELVQAQAAREAVGTGVGSGWD
eukprot:2855-Heterococcus_DN1.PRE.2